MVLTVSKQTKLDDLKKDIVSMGVCKDLSNTANNLVFGDGNPDAELMFIGEAPGKNEDEQGLPFVGAAGKFLNEMLAGINLKREQVYITNIVKYRPPNNRDPMPEEKLAFVPFLMKQIEIIKPLLIITLGRHSMECFLPNQQISKIHGQPKRIKGQIILPLYHPAAALYNGSMREILVDDFNLIPEILRLLRQER